MASFKLATFVLLASTLALALPTSDIEARQGLDTSSHCGQWDVVSAGPYSLLADLWGASGATSGSQCSSLISLSGNTISWKTTWNWVGGNGVKSFSNIQLNQGINKQLSSIKSMPVSRYSSYIDRPLTEVATDYVEVVAEHFWEHRG